MSKANNEVEEGDVHTNMYFEMKNNKAPGSDGLPTKFYRRCWVTIKGDLMAMFHDIFNGDI